MELPNRPTKDPYQEIPVKDFSYINTQKKPRKNTHTWALVVAGVIVLALLGAGAFIYGHYTKNKAAKTPKTESHQTSPSVTNTPAQAPNISLTPYSSSVFNLIVNYPTTWAIGTNGNTSMSISSPEMALTSANGKSVEGKIVVNVFNQGQVPAAFGTSSVAVLNSQDITFSSPTSNQAQQTYISFVQYPATTALGGLDGIYMSGNNGYLKGQTVPVSGVNQISPLVVVSFEDCQNSACSSPASLSVASTMWSNPNFQTPILDILKSFSFS